MALPHDRYIWPVFQTQLLIFENMCTDALNWLIGKRSILALLLSSVIMRIYYIHLLHLYHIRQTNQEVESVTYVLLKTAMKFGNIDNLAYHIFLKIDSA